MVTRWQCVLVLKELSHIHVLGLALPALLSWFIPEGLALVTGPLLHRNRDAS